MEAAFREGAAARGDLATKADIEAALTGLATKAALAALEVRMTNRLHAAVFAVIKLP